MSTAFKQLEIPPGVVSKATKKQRSSNWSEVNLIRWREGQLMPIGGQVQYAYAFASRCKAIHGWYDLNASYHIAYLCEQHLYVDNGGVLVDITPSGGMAPPSSTTMGGYGDGVYGTGIYGDPRTLTVGPQLDKVPDAYSLDNFGGILYAMTSRDGRLLSWDPMGGSGISVDLAATQAFTKTQPANTITMAANPGTVTPGMSVYDTTLTAPAFIGTVLTYVGSSLVLTAPPLFASQGAADVLRFSNAARPQTADTGRGVVPTGRCFVVTPERFIVIFGAQDSINGGGFRRFAWCDQENPGAWDYQNVVSQAGFLDIEPASPIVAAISTRTGTLFWTGKKAYRSRFLGIPYIFNYEELADATTPWSPQSVVNTSSMVLWMSEQGPFSYDGTSILPVACMVRPWVDDDIDLLFVRSQACAVHVENYSEFWWFYPQKDKSTNTRCVYYNYKEGWWAQGTMSRSAGVTAAYNAHTIMADGLVAFQHELLETYVNADPPWAETFDLNLGPRLTTVKQLMPDVEGDISNLKYSLFYRNSRSLGEDEQRSAPVSVRADGYVDFRVTGRDVRLRIDIAGSPVRAFTLGQHLIDAVPRGDR